MTKDYKSIIFGVLASSYTLLGDDCTSFVAELVFVPK
jgi:hypothetical protein